MVSSFKLVRSCRRSRSASLCETTARFPRRLGQHREGGSILLGSIGSTPEIELLSPIPALVSNYAR